MSVSGLGAQPGYQRAVFAAIASRSGLAPHVIAYWLTSAKSAAAAASFSSCGAAKSGKPWARLTAPASTASRFISRMTDSVNDSALALIRRMARSVTAGSAVHAPARSAPAAAALAAGRGGPRRRWRFAYAASAMTNSATAMITTIPTIGPPTPTRSPWSATTATTIARQPIAASSPVVGRARPVAGPRDEHRETEDAPRT